MSFLAGLFVGEGKFEEIRDNLDLGAMVSLTQESRAADSRSSPRGDSYRPRRADISASPWTHTLRIPGHSPSEDLLPYRTAREPPCQQEALNRRKIMRKARSKKKRPFLLADLERRYRETPIS